MKGVRPHGQTIPPEARIGVTLIVALLGLGEGQTANQALKVS